MYILYYDISYEENLAMGYLTVRMIEGIVIKSIYLERIDERLSCSKFNKTISKIYINVISLSTYLRLGLDERSLIVLSIIMHKEGLKAME